MSKLSLKDMLLEMAEKLYDDEECKDAESTEKLIARANGLISITKTMNEMTKTKLEIVRLQVEKNIRIDDSDAGYKKLPTLPSKGKINGLPYEE